MVARYPNLWPQPIPNDIQQNFAEWESRIAQNAEAAVCLKGMSSEQRRQLAALLLDTIDALKGRAGQHVSSEWAMEVRKEAPTRLRGLDRRFQKAREALEELLDYALDRQANRRDASRHSARQMLGHSHRVAAGKALKALEVKNLPSAQEHIELAGETLMSVADAPEVFGMVQLYWFFKHECRLSGHESEVRTARLRNAFWREFGVRPVPYRAKSITGKEPRGCGAVRQAVRRYRP